MGCFTSFSYFEIVHVQFELEHFCNKVLLKFFRVVQPHQQQLFDEEEMPASENEEAGPSKRKRQPSMSETMPLYTMCKEDLESMDKEVS